MTARPDDSDETPPIKSGEQRLLKPMVGETPARKRVRLLAGAKLRGLFYNFDGWVFETPLGPLSVWTSCVVYEKPETKPVA